MTLKSCASFRLGARLAGTISSLFFSLSAHSPLTHPPIQPAAAVTAQCSHGCRLLILPRVSATATTAAATEGGAAAATGALFSASESLAADPSRRDGREPRIESSTAREEHQVEQCADSPLRLLTGCPALRRLPLSAAVFDCCRLFWSQEMEIAVLGLGNAGKSSFVHVINVSAMAKSSDEGCSSSGQRTDADALRVAESAGGCDADIPHSPITQRSGRRTAAACAACEGAQLREGQQVHLRQSSRACPTRHRLSSALPRRRGL